MVFSGNQPGGRARNPGIYEQLNVFGTPTGILAAVDEGDGLPDAPRGFTWRPLSELSSAELRARAAEYRRMAATARTAAVAQSLHSIADRFEAVADKRDREQREPG